MRKKVLTYRYMCIHDYYYYKLCVGVYKPSSASSLTTPSSTPSRRHSSTRTSLSTDAELAEIRVVQLIYENLQNNSIVESRDPNLASTMRNKCLELQGEGEGLAHLPQAAPSQIQLEMQTPGHPGKPHATEVSYNSLVLSWGKPQCGADSVQSYTITYRAVDDPPGRSHNQTASQPERTELTNLAAKTTYLFKVRAESAAGVSGPYSETSDPIETKCLHLDAAGLYSKTSVPIETRCLVRLADCKLSQIQLGGVKAYLLPTHETMRKSGILKFTVGQSQQHVPHKILMLVGTAGAGKTTLITAMANYIMGVDWEDEFRFKLISEDTAHDQTRSQTKCITAYTFHKDEGSPHPYTLTVIDTPGFGDTGGVEKNKKIVQQIKELLHLRGHEGIDQLHGIGFVTQAPMAPLTPTQRYVFDNVLSVFGKDVADNIFLMITFAADGQEPPVLDAVRAADFPFSNHFTLDNSAFCASKVQDDCDKNHKMHHWQLGRRRLEKFFDHFSGAHAQSLHLSREVLQEREQLEITLQDLQSQIRAELTKINELQQERQLLKGNEADVIAFKDFTYQVEVTKQRKVNLPVGQSTTNCLQCNYTCHCPCSCYKDGEKFKCSAMNNSGSLDATCSECPNQCSWKDHVNRSYRIEQYNEQETRLSDELKARYESAMTRKCQVESVIKEMEEELKEMNREVLQKTEEAKQSLQRLQEIALKPPADHFTKYIHTLIETEQQEALPRLSECKKALQKVQSMLKSIPKF